MDDNLRDELCELLTYLFRKLKGTIRAAHRQGQGQGQGQQREAETRVRSRYMDHFENSVGVEV
eukprot:755742-Hanusia_phi.AAC.2